MPRPSPLLIQWVIAPPATASGVTSTVRTARTTDRAAEGANCAGSRRFSDRPRRRWLDIHGLEAIELLGDRGDVTEKAVARGAGQRITGLSRRRFRSPPGHD